MRYITMILMKHQLRIAKKEQIKCDNTIVKQAYDNLIKSYKSTIIFLDR